MEVEALSLPTDNLNALPDITYKLQISVRTDISIELDSN